MFRILYPQAVLNVLDWK